MQIALYNIEPKIYNTALMQISQYHKSKGDQVEWYFDLKRYSYDKIYCSSLFDFTDKQLVPSEAIKGGSGYDICSKLPDEIQESDLDYSIYPDCEKSLIFFSRGCIRKCPFCIVNRKEGFIKAVKPKNLNPNGKEIEVLDNNFFANPEWRESIAFIQFHKQPVNLQGVDIRIMNEEQATALNSIKHSGAIHIAWDNPKDDLIGKMQELVKIVKAYKIMCYVLIGYWSTPEQDYERVMKLKEIGIGPFVMAYNKKDTYQRRFARWVNHKAIFKSVAWQDYK